MKIYGRDSRNEDHDKWQPQSKQIANTVEEADCRNDRRRPYLSPLHYLPTPQNFKMKKCHDNIEADPHVTASAGEAESRQPSGDFSKRQPANHKTPTQLLRRSRLRMRPWYSTVRVRHRLSAITTPAPYDADTDWYASVRLLLNRVSKTSPSRKRVWIRRRISKLRMG